MSDKRIPRDRKKKRARAEKSQQRYARHPLFGQIPLIHHQASGSDGKIYDWWEYDANYQPTLPRHAVRGDVRKQNYCAAHHYPKYFYVDEPRECIQCGDAFIFHASEQKYWYETLKFNFSSIPVRCIKCRRERRSEHSLREQIARAKANIPSNDPAAYIALARAIVEYHEKTELGDLNEAIAAARKAQSLWPEAAEPSLWEGIAHARAARPAKARLALTRFLASAENTPATLRRRAESYLQK